LVAPPSGLKTVDARAAEMAALAGTDPSYAGGIVDVVLATEQPSVAIPEGESGLPLVWAVAMQPRAKNGHLVVFVDARLGQAATGKAFTTMGGP
jgi:hypothetical protein